MDNLKTCRVCGLILDFFPWGEDGTCPNYDYCDCCGVEYGNQDHSISSTIEYRKQWIDNGAPWDNQDRKPLNWDLDKQLANISIIYL